MLDVDLAVLYGVQTKALVQALKRDRARFPADFVFELTAGEVANLRSQTVTSKPRRGGRRTRPYAFTEHGVAMLASVLRSPRRPGNAFMHRRDACRRPGNALVVGQFDFA